MKLAVVQAKAAEHLTRMERLMMDTSERWRNDALWALFWRDGHYGGVCDNWRGDDDYYYSKMEARAADEDYMRYHVETLRCCFSDIMQKVIPPAFYVVP